jgi:putative membrane-bound dehydrogenase-like protein
MPPLHWAAYLVAVGVGADAPKSPVAPADEKATFALAPGLRIDLVAAEPEIEAPVAAAFDERGKLWVVEMRDYPNGPPKGEKPLGRIKILEDNDGDGRYETATVFAEHLSFANGVLPWDGGAIVTAAPHILFLKDTDGDGTADVRRVMYEGFVAGNPQLRVSHPVLGPDGWVYVANGLRGGEVRRAGQPNAPAVPLGGKDFRFDPVRDRAEAVPGPGQFGNTFDRWGNRFVCDNRNHLRHVVFPADPGQSNPLLAVPSLLEDTAGPADGPLNSGTKVYPLTRNWTTSNLHAGRFTAACGVFADPGGLLPAPYAGGVLTCEPTGNLVHMETLTPTGATFRSTPWKDGTEFLASRDEWFRPVSLTQAPDGALLLVDMYRAVIEHPEWMPPEQKNRPDLLLGKERGRLWRIAPEGSKPGGKPSLPGRLPTTLLVEQLADPVGWQRATAQRLLLTRTDPATTNLLTAFAAATDSPAGLILAAGLLDARDALPAEVLHRMAGHPHPRVREHAARLLAPLAADPDARVRFQTALALGDDVGLLADIAARDAADKWTRLAVASSVRGRAAELAAALLGRPDFADPSPDRLQLIQMLCELVGSAKDAAGAGRLVGALAKLDPRWQRAGLTGLAEGVARRGTPFPKFLEALPDGPAAVALLAGATTFGDADADRVAAVRLLGHSPWDAAGTKLAGLLSAEDTSPAVRVATVRALAAQPRPEVAGVLLGGWRGYTPALRAEALDALVGRPDRAAALLTAVEGGQVKTGDIDPARARRLTASADAALAARAKKVLKDSLPAARKGVIDAYRPALAMAAEVARGRAVFAKNCAACHAVAGVGASVGPDVSDTRTKTPEMLLTDILDPNAAIDGNYVSYLVTTKDGKSLTGLVASESAAGLTLKRENGQTDAVLRADVEEVRSSGLSLMPEGLEKAMTPQDVADLIRFLKDWRY